MSVKVAALGFPRIGPRRELKTALEASWSGKIEPQALIATARDLRAANWQRQKALGLDIIPSNDFSLYDQVLDTAAMVGAVPEIYGWKGGDVSLDTYFAMARGALGTSTVCEHGHVHTSGGVPAMEMTKWFDTNYHYIVPEFTKGQTFRLSTTKAVDEFREARALGIHTRPVLVGPVTFLKLGKSKDDSFNRLSLLPQLLPVYADVLNRLKAEGADWVQIDEPILVLDLTGEEQAALKTAYAELGTSAPGLNILVATYFGELGDNLDTAVNLPVAGLHVDLKRGPNQLDALLNAAPKDLVLSLGVIDGRNVWRADLEAALDLLEPVVRARGSDKIVVSTSCSLLHVPIDLDQEAKLDPDLKTWLVLRGAEDRRAVCARPRARRRAHRCRRRTSGKLGSSNRQKTIAEDPRSGCPGADEGDHARDDHASALRRAPQGPAEDLQSSGFPNDDDRLLPANGGRPKGARRPHQGYPVRHRLHRLPEAGDGGCRALAGGDRLGRSRSRRVRA